MSTPIQQSLFDAAPPLVGAPAFIERQFSVARLSMESYKERRSNYSQTLTFLGKWWGRRPLILVRAAMLGLLLPATDDLLLDREIFLKLLTMDDVGLRWRRSKAIPGARLLAELEHMPLSQRRRFLDPDAPSDASRLKAKLNREECAEMQDLVFARMPYAEKLEYCDRPEQISDPSEEAWNDINAHLGTSARSLPQLVEQLGVRRFGHVPRIGDAFCGGGSVPFEAVRIGCGAYGADLNPVAALLTWAGLNIVGGGPEVAVEVRRAQQAVFDAVDRQITAWGVKHNEQGWRADAYLYCVEVIDPESGWRVPLAPSWVIGEKTRNIAKLAPDDATQSYRIEIHQGVTSEEIAAARAAGTVRDSRVVHSRSEQEVLIEVVRRNLRLWEQDDMAPRPEDVFQERLYCIRWVETLYNESGEVIGELRHYRAPTADDLQREEWVLCILKERFQNWQEHGYIPSRRIEKGDETSRLQRERGWTYWHHLFTPRQLLMNGLFTAIIKSQGFDAHIKTACVLGVGRLADWNSKLCRWIADATKENGAQVFSNQALNTLNNYYGRALSTLSSKSVDISLDVW